MAFHISTAGVISARLQRYADETGLIPEPGDRWQDFQWEHEVVKAFADKTTGEASWQTFVAQAKAETEKAWQELEDLEWN